VKSAVSVPCCRGPDPTKPHATSIADHKCKRKLIQVRAGPRASARVACVDKCGGGLSFAVTGRGLRTPYRRGVLRRGGSCHDDRGWLDLGFGAILYPQQGDVRES